MAIVDANAQTSATSGSSVVIMAALGGNITSNVADRGPCPKVNGTIVRVITAPGATPTCTYTIEKSADNSSWTAATYADVSTPTTDVATTFVLTGGFAEKIIKGTGWRYLRVTTTLNTNVTNTIQVVFSDGKKYV